MASLGKANVRSVSDLINKPESQSGFSGARYATTLGGPTLEKNGARLAESPAPSGDSLVHIYGTDRLPDKPFTRTTIKNAIAKSLPSEGNPLFLLAKALVATHGTRLSSIPFAMDNEVGVVTFGYEPNNTMISFGVMGETGEVINLGGMPLPEPMLDGARLANFEKNTLQTPARVKEIPRAKAAAEIILRDIRRAVREVRNRIFRGSMGGDGRIMLDQKKIVVEVFESEDRYNELKTRGSWSLMRAAADKVKDLFAKGNVYFQ